MDLGLLSILKCDRFGPVEVNLSRHRKPPRVRQKYTYVATENTLTEQNKRLGLFML